jgi:hypothetical protein
MSQQTDLIGLGAIALLGVLAYRKAESLWTNSPAVQATNTVKETTKEIYNTITNTEKSISEAVSTVKDIRDSTDKLVIDTTKSVIDAGKNIYTDAVNEGKKEVKDATSGNSPAARIINSVIDFNVPGVGQGGASAPIVKDSTAYKNPSGLASGSVTRDTSPKLNILPSTGNGLPSLTELNQAKVLGNNAVSLGDLLTPKSSGGSKPGSSSLGSASKSGSSSSKMISLKDAARGSSRF